MPDKAETEYLLCGTNVDKKIDFHNKKIINRDRDIKKLIRKGKFPFVENFLFLLFFLLVIIWAIINDSSEIFHQIPNELVIIQIVAIALWLIHLTESLKHFTENSIGIIKYFKYAWSAKAVKNPLDLWTPITNSGISDAQTALFLNDQIHSESADCLVSLIYSGDPYFRIKAVDSITVGWNHSWLKYMQHRSDYRHLYTEYAVEIIKAFAQEKYFKFVERELCISNSVFGILFLSKYLRMETNKIKKGQKVKVKISNDIKNKNDVDERFAKELLELSMSPEYFTWNTEDQEIEEKGAELYIYTIDYIDDQTEKNIFSNFICQLKISVYNMLHKRIRIPVKRYLALPKVNKSNQMLHKILNSDYKNDSDSGSKSQNETQKETKVFVMGGAEQNLGLLYLVNKYRWSSHNDFKIGIAENVFEEYYAFRLKVGTEGFVYGISNIINQRQDTRADTNKMSAEIFTFHFDDNPNIKYYCIYGYNAIMTKIAAYNLFNAFMEGNEQNIPGKRIITNNCIKYEIDRNVIEIWDKYDVLNTKNLDKSIKDQFNVNTSDI
jgi:hypothetical protein